jgi:hypothetical protein
MSNLEFCEEYSEYLEKFYHQCQASTNDGKRCKNKTRENYCEGLHAMYRNYGSILKPGFERYPGAAKTNWTKAFERRHVVPDYNEKDYNEMQEKWAVRYEKSMEKYEREREKRMEKYEREKKDCKCSWCQKREDSETPSVRAFGGMGAQLQQPDFSFGVY